MNTTTNSHNLFVVSSDGGNEQLQLGDTLPIWVNVDVTGCGSTVNYNNKTMAGTNDCLLRC